MLTKKDLLEAIEDMPMDAKIKILYFDENEEEYKSYLVEDISINEHLNTIILSRKNHRLQDEEYVKLTEKTTTMKQYTDKDQTIKLIELGFPKPKSICLSLDNDIMIRGAYSIGELIEFLGKNLLEIGVTTMLDFPIKHFVRFKKDPTKVGYIQVQGELIDKLVYACITLKEGGVI